MGIDCSKFGHCINDLLVNKLSIYFFPLASTTHDEHLQPMSSRSQSRPDKYTNIAWNNSWEKRLDEYYSDLSLTLFDAMTPVHLDFLKASYGTDQVAIKSRTKDACSVQRMLNEVAVTELAYCDLEERWRACTQAERESVVLGGIFWAAQGSVELEENRLWCPEITVKLLAGNDPNWGFLNLLKRFLPVDKSSSDIVDPVLISSEKFDLMTRLPPNSADDKGLKSHVRLIALERCVFMSSTLLGILAEIVSIFYKSIRNRSALTSLISERAVTKWRKKIIALRSDQMNTGRHWARKMTTLKREGWKQSLHHYQPPDKGRCAICYESTVVN